MSSSQSQNFVIRHFDGHVYFTADSREQAAWLREKLLESLRGKVSYVGPLIDRKVGPHPLPMFEIHFAPDFLAEILLWLMAERSGLTVLIHQVTGDDPRDHDQGALWLGQSLVLDNSKLDPSPSHS
jgi:aromatic ring-cleaving dioxygenase